MIPIQEFEIEAGTDILFRTPQLTKLNTKKELSTVTNTFLKDLYLEQPKEALGYFKYELSERMVTTIFKNYGIDSIYYKQLNPLITRNLVYYLEYLFQTKGSLETFNIFNDLFSSFYNNIDFYNISVSKIPVNSGNYKLAYILKPLKLTDNKEQTKFFPNADINLSGKYLMSINQYRDYKFFPIDTNIVYIDFADSSSTANNNDFFLQGIRAYSNTLLQGSSFQLSLGKTETFENMYFTDIELILEYLQVRLMRLGEQASQRDYDFSFQGLVFSTSLILREETLPELESILQEYKELDPANRKALNNIKRRWQYLLNSNKSSERLYNNFQELDAYIQGEYPNIHSNSLLMTEVNDYMDFYIQLYGTVLEEIDAKNNFISSYYGAVFQNVISGNLFIKNFFQPLFKIFVKYFFPASMDYAQMVGQNVKIKDKFNSIGTEIIVSTQTLLNEFSPHLHYINSVSSRIRSIRSTEYENRLDNISTITNNNINEALLFETIFRGIITSKVETEYDIQESISQELLISSLEEIRNNIDSTNTILCSTKKEEYLRKNSIAYASIKSIFNSESFLSSRNRSEQMPVDILIKTSDQYNINDIIDCIRLKGSFYTTDLTFEEYEYLIARVSGITSAGLLPLENYEVRLYDMFLTEDDVINTYLAYNL